jgi:hypothetical protein
MTRALLLLIAVGCGDPPSSAPPADPAHAPAPTATQVGGTPAPATTASPVTDNVDLVVACQQAGETYPDAASAQGSTAGELNTLGYRCYKAGDMAAAARLFGLAIQLDEAHALAHYNLACALALLRRSGPPCEHDATLRRILHHLERAVAIDPKRRERMREDADLDDIRSNLRYRVLDGVRANDPEGIRAALAGVTLYGMPQGAFGSLWRASFAGPGDGSETSIVTVTVRTVTDDGVGPPREVTGRWSAGPGRLTLKLPDGTPGAGSFAISPTGDLVDTRKQGVEALVWLSAPDECSA